MSTDGLNRDFKFYKDLEKRVDEKSDRLLNLQKDIFRESAEDRRLPVKGSNYDSRLKALGITVYRAPMGMSRRKQNKSRWSLK